MAEGSGWFSGRDQKRAGIAVVRGDVAALQGLGKRIDVNVKGAQGVTLMQLAVSPAFLPPRTPPAASSTVDVVRALLALGADANEGVEMATKLPDVAILEMLLDAGAKPDHVEDRDPVVFHWLGVMPAANFTALLDHGLSPDIVDGSGTPLIIEAGRNDRWDFVIVLLARGADATRTGSDGTSLADVVESRTSSTSSRPPEMMRDIERVRAQLAARPHGAAH